MSAKAQETREERLEEQFAALPPKPGVYLFRGARAILRPRKALCVTRFVRGDSVPSSVTC